MAGFPTDVAVVGTVLALAVAILLLSGLALYVAFRVRETLREERGSGARAAKVAFLIGLLFLSGGAFYFFASGFHVLESGPTTSTTNSYVSTSTGTSSLTSSSSTAIITSTAVSTTKTSGQGISMPAPSCQGTRVTVGSSFTCVIYIYNQGSATLTNAVIVSSGDFTSFTFQSCTESVNGGPSTQVTTSSSTVAVGDVAPGTTVLSLTVQAPSQSGQYSSSTLTLNAPGLPAPISVTFGIQVTA
jgi:hypothetical protein